MLDKEVVSAVALGNLKAISEQPAMYSNLAYSNSVSNNNIGGQNAVANQQAMNELGVSVIAKGSKTVTDLQPLSARSAVDILTNDELAQTIADLKATVEAFAKKGGGSSGKSGRFNLKKLLKQLIELGIRLDEQGRIVVSGPPVSFIVEGQYSQEDVTLTFENERLEITVNKGA